MSNAVSRTPGGHPEGYLEAFANIYSEAATAIRRAKVGETTEGCLPGFLEGAFGNAFYCRL